MSKASGRDQIPVGWPGLSVLWSASLYASKAGNRSAVSFTVPKRAKLYAGQSNELEAGRVTDSEMCQAAITHYLTYIQSTS